MPHIEDAELEYNHHMAERAAKRRRQEEERVLWRARRAQAARQLEQAQAQEAAQPEPEAPEAAAPETSPEPEVAPEAPIAPEETPTLGALGEDPSEEEEGAGFFGTLIDIDKQIVKGLGEAGVNTAQTILDLGGFIDSGIDVAEIAKSRGFDIGEAETGAGQFAKSTSQFLAGFIPALGALRALKGVSSVSALLKAAQVGRYGRTGAVLTGTSAKFTAAGAVADFSVFDPHEARFSDMLQDLGFDNPVTDYLAASDDDSAAEGRLKNVIEGAGLGLVFEGIVRGLRAARGTKDASEVAMSQFRVDPLVMKPLQQAHDTVIHEMNRADMLTDINKTLRDLNEVAPDPVVGEARARLSAEDLAGETTGREALSPEARQLIEGAELRGIDFEDSIRASESARESVVDQIAKLNPEVGARIRAGTADIRESLEKELKASEADLKQAQEVLFDARQSDDYASLPKSVRKHLEDQIEKYC